MALLRRSAAAAKGTFKRMDAFHNHYFGHMVVGGAAVGSVVGCSKPFKSFAGFEKCSNRRCVEFGAIVGGVTGVLGPLRGPIYVTMVALMIWGDCKTSLFWT